MAPRLLPVNPNKRPPPMPEKSGRIGFSGLEWNALINRARSLLEALRQCEGEPGTPCAACPMAAAGSDGHPQEQAAACRSNFRALEQRLAHLANLAPEPERQQLRRTVDGLHLAYRQLDTQEAPNE